MPDVEAEVHREDREEPSHEEDVERGARRQEVDENLALVLRRARVARRLDGNRDVHVDLEYDEESDESELRSSMDVRPAHERPADQPEVRAKDQDDQHE